MTDFGLGTLGPRMPGAGGRNDRGMRLAQGWPIVGWAALVVVAIVAAILITLGTGEAGLRAAIRATARTSVVLFCVAFSASALRRLWPGTASAWLLANRRQLGVSFAVS